MKRCSNDWATANDLNGRRGEAVSDISRGAKRSKFWEAQFICLILNTTPLTDKRPKIMKQVNVVKLFRQLGQSKLECFFAGLSKIV
jgi:hypothetical protein